MSSIAMFFSACQGIIPIAVVVVLIVVLVKKSSFSFKPFGVGILIFIVFSQILESLLHLFVLKTNHSTSTFFAQHPYTYATYAAIAAGLFEEIGRYIGFRVFLRSFREWKDGISYGLGHGGIEALLIGNMTAIQTIVFGVLVNTGKLPTTLPADVKTSVLNLVHQPAYMFALGAIERLAALSIQIALSLIILYGIKRKSSLYLVLAILLHAVIDFVSALYQKHVVSLVTVESVTVVFSIIAVAFIIRSRQFFKENV
jgi:uncharacterized membrane protein YhfC